MFRNIEINFPNLTKYVSGEVVKLIASRGGFQLRSELGTDPSVYYLPP